MGRLLIDTGSLRISDLLGSELPEIDLEESCSSSKALDLKELSWDWDFRARFT